MFAELGLTLSRSSTGVRAARTGFALAAMAVLAAAASSDILWAQDNRPAGPAAASPTLIYVFSARITLSPPVEVGTIEDGRRRFIGITGGTVSGPRLSGVVLPGGGDWQTIQAAGLTQVEAKYFLKASDGTVIEVANPGVRVASPEVTERIAKGEAVEPDQYYFRTTPSFRVGTGKHDWLRRSVFVARGIRRPDHVIIDYYRVV